MHVETLKKEVDVYLNNYFNNRESFNRKLFEAMSYSLNIGGKRIRPILNLLTYGLYNDNYKEAMPVAGAIEMIHTYSLIHDDLPCMDDDNLRRGKPTNHKVFGENLAVLAGDGLLNEAFSILIESALNKGLNFLKAAKVIAEAAGTDGMIAGQTVDILSEGKSVELDELYYMHNKKTGELIRASIISGATMAGACSKDLESLKKFGEMLGLAFQIKDDILDVVGNKDKIGKSLNKDKKNNKTTFVKKYGLEQCKNMCNELSEECIEVLNNMERDTSKLEELTLFLLKRDY
ncbi:polyprenyl synthetase family protein [Clostridium rectalis]|uniref:polyprenyl synthetase family protein n=1 Tax=Clostridium rectalis TaxID=2040295 RepID=UPI000F6397E3|nr:farnesyl diphosphate synthase [Clostridium rectalis]